MARNNLRLAGCSICGYNKCINALEFHHVNSDSKDVNISKAKTLRKVYKEAAKCIVVCANCHREIEAGMHDIDNIPRAYIITQRQLDLFGGE